MSKTPPKKIKINKLSKKRSLQIYNNYLQTLNPKNRPKRADLIPQSLVSDGKIFDFPNNAFPGKKKTHGIVVLENGVKKTHKEYEKFVMAAVTRGVRAIKMLSDDLSLLTKIQYFNFVVKNNRNLFKQDFFEHNAPLNKKFLLNYGKQKKIDKDTLKEILKVAAESSFRNDDAYVRTDAPSLDPTGGRILYTDDDPPNYRLLNLISDEPVESTEPSEPTEPTNPPTVTEISVEPTGETTTDDDLVVEEENKGQVVEDDDPTDKLETEIVKEQQVEQPQQPIEQPKREALAGEQLLSSVIDFSVLGNNIPYIDRLKFEFNNLSDARFKEFYESKMNSNDWRDVMNLNNDKKYQQLLKIAEQLDGLIITYNSNEDLTLHLKVVWLMLMNQVENKMIETSALSQTQTTPTILDRPVQQQENKSLGVVIDVQDLGLNVNKLKQMLSENKSMEPPKLERQEQFTGFSSDFITQFRQSVKDKKAQPQQKDKDTVTVKKDNMVVEKNKRRRRILIKKPWILRDKHDMKIKREAKKENKPLGKLRIRKK